MLNGVIFPFFQGDEFDGLDGVNLPVANEQLRNANEGLPLAVSCESANEICNLESQKLISDLM